MPSSRGSSRPRDWTHISCLSCTSRQVLYTISATWEAPASRGVRKISVCCLSHSVCSISLWQLSLTKTGPIGVAPGQEKTSWGCSQAGHAGLRWPHQRECRVTLWDTGSPLERRQEQDGVVAVTVPLALPLTTGPPPRTLRAGVTGGNTTFSRLASGHSVSIQSVATSPIRLSPLAMFLWGQWERGGEKGQCGQQGQGTQGQEIGSKDGMQDAVKVAGGTVRGCDG